MQSELKKLEGLFEKVDEVAAKQSEKPIVLTPEEPKVKAEPEKPIERAIPEPRKEVKKEIRTEEIPVKEPEHKEETIVTTKAVVNEENITNEEVNADAEKTAEAKIIAGLSAEISDEVTVITEGTSLKGDLESTGSFELRGKIEGNVRCNGKVTITGSIHGNAEASEFFADAAKVEGEISTSGTVKIGLGSVVVGNITATSAVIAGAIKGDIDVQGPVVTIPTSTPSSVSLFTCSATRVTVGSSNPVCFSPASASPLNFNNILFIECLSYLSKKVSISTSA